jgi:myo-inositol-1(or 4)-monophosphatase
LVASDKVVILICMFDPDTERAVRAALDAHAGQSRKSAAHVPYVAHPIHVALILARLGYPPRVLQAALLHDVVEDCEGWTSARIEREFGAEVARTVAELTEDKSLTWEERKRAQIDHAPHLSPDALAVKAADKLHNLCTLAADLRAAADPESVWARFRAGRARTLAMSRELVDSIAARCDAPLASALRGAIADLERASG